MTKWENQYVVFDVTKGPKVIIETLNTYGEEGWECASMLTVANTNIVAFLKRKQGEEPKGTDEAEELSKLWAANGKGK